MDDVDVEPKFCRPRAASSPSRPPPITAARLLCPARRPAMPRQSSRVRKTKTPGLQLPSGIVQPSIGGMKGRLPVAMISWS